MKSMEERIEEAIVARFFEPSWMVSTQQLMDPTTGQYRTEVVPHQVPSQMSVIADAIYKQARTEILQKVIERMDIDAIVAEWAPKIAVDVVNQLQSVPGNSWMVKPSSSERQKMMDKVYEAVAEEFGRQAIEHIKNTGGLMAVLEA